MIILTLFSLRFIDIMDNDNTLIEETAVVEEKELIEEPEIEKCCVCTSKIIGKVILECGHEFCTDCIFRIVDGGNNSCPLCRTVFYTPPSLIEDFPIRSRIYDLNDPDDIGGYNGVAFPRYQRTQRFRTESGFVRIVRWIEDRASFHGFVVLMWIIIIVLLYVVIRKVDGLEHIITQKQ